MRFLVLVLLLATVACGGRPEAEAPTASPEPPADLKVVNADRPGEPLDLRAHLSAGRTTLFEFYSDQCPPCREMERVMEYLAEHNRELGIRRVNIDRRGHAGIDFDSPLAEQQGVEAVPSFRVYSPEGRLVAHGEAAKDQVRRWYSEAQMIQRAEQMPAVSERYRKEE